jgi:hypothetical protein
MNRNGYSGISACNVSNGRIIAPIWLPDERVHPVVPVEKTLPRTIVVRDAAFAAD